LLALAAGSRAQGYRVEVAGKVASLLVGPGAQRLIELEAQARRRFYLVPKEGAHLDHFLVLAEGKRDELAVEAPFQEGAEIQLTLGEVGLHDPRAGVGKLDGFDVCVADAASLVGKKVKVHVERVLDQTAYATLVRRGARLEEPITAEREAEKPTRARASSRKEAAPVAEPQAAEQPPPAEKREPGAKADEAEAKPKTRTRRGSRGGRSRRKKPATDAAADNGAGVPEEALPAVARVHAPDPDLGAEPPDEPISDEAPTEDGAATKRKKTRRGTRGGRNRRRRTAATAAEQNGGDAAEAAAAEDAAEAANWEYVPMSEWGDEIPSKD
jgi:predicted RNA-binding protein with TRAM domain